MWDPTLTHLLILGYSLHRKDRSLVVLLFPKHSSGRLAGAIYTEKVNIRIQLRYGRYLCDTFLVRKTKIDTVRECNII